MSAPDRAAPTDVTLRCGFCLTLNRISMDRAGNPPACGQCSKPMLLDRPVRVDEADFEATVLEAGTPVLVDFYADWCAPCRLAAPVLDEIAGANVGALLVAKVDTDRAPGLSQQFGIRSIPTMILFDAGEEVTRVVGFDAQGLRDMATQARGD